MLFRSSQWLPIEDSFEKQLVERLVRDGRTFVKGLRYNLPPDALLASVTLTEASKAPIPLRISSREFDAGQTNATAVEIAAAASCSTWVWHIATGPMPPLPTTLGLASALGCANA